MNEYKIVRNIGSPLFKMIYNPIIIDKEFIPKNGPVIFCGNHLHVWDQVPVACSTKIPIHWMAKKEYFDSKLGFFYESMGCISVDRLNNPHESKEKAINLLQNGDSIGIFPEGTRNNVKFDKQKEIYQEYFGDETSFEQFKNEFLLQKPLFSKFELLDNLYKNGKININDFKKGLLNMNEYIDNLVKKDKIDSITSSEAELLPFHYGAVSMAKKTDVNIVPFAVNGDYKVNSKNLIISFGQPYMVKNEDLEVENKKLRQKVLTLINKNKKICK